jgi:hypothetical protein
MRSSKKEILQAIYSLGYATSETIAIETDLPNGNKHMREMEKRGWIRPVYQYGGTVAERNKPENKIFAITYKGRLYLGNVPRGQQFKEKSFRDLPHQKKLVKSIMGIYWPHRKTHSMTVKHKHIFQLRDGTNYECDALVTLYNIKTGERLYFIIEMEITKSESQILKVKIAKNEKMKRFDEYGLSRKTKIIYIKSSCHDDNAEEDRLFKTLLKQAGHLKDHYLFARYQDWHEYDKANFYLANGERIKLIN